MVDFSDILILVGAVLITTGIWLIYPPAALIVAGSLCFVGGLVGARRRPALPPLEE